MRWKDRSEKAQWVPTARLIKGGVLHLGVLQAVEKVFVYVRSLFSAQLITGK